MTCRSRNPLILVLTYDLSFKVISEFKAKDFGENGQNLKLWAGQPAAFDRMPTSLYTGTVELCFFSMCCRAFTRPVPTIFTYIIYKCTVLTCYSVTHKIDVLCV